MEKFRLDKIPTPAFTGGEVRPDVLAAMMRA
jgi:hypothetical protein